MHLDDAQLEAFAIGALEDDAMAAFVDHASSCDDCAKRLADQARLELALPEIALAARSRKVADVRTISPLRQWAAPIAIVAAAAAILFVIRKSSSSVPLTALDTTASKPIPLVICPDGPNQGKCVQDAHRRGLYVMWPDWAGAPALGGRRDGAGPADSPFSIAER